jgi:hypothetical protein
MEQQMMMQATSAAKTINDAKATSGTAVGTAVHAVADTTAGWNVNANTWRLGEITPADDK